MCYTQVKLDAVSGVVLTYKENVLVTVGYIKCYTTLCAIHHLTIMPHFIFRNCTINTSNQLLAKSESGNRRTGVLGDGEETRN